MSANHRPLTPPQPPPILPPRWYQSRQFWRGHKGSTTAVHTTFVAIAHRPHNGHSQLPFLSPPPTAEVCLNIYIPHFKEAHIVERKELTEIIGRIGHLAEEKLRTLQQSSMTSKGYDIFCSIDKCSQLIILQQLLKEYSIISNKPCAFLDTNKLMQC